jgi:regulatory protein
MIISSLKKQVKNPQRVSVFVDGNYSFSLSLDEIVNQKIKKDLELDAAAIKRLKKISADDKMRERALSWLLNRPHSKREFADYLRRKKSEPALSEQLEKQFTQKGYLDDSNYARWLVDIRQRAGKSNRAIRAELYKKGVGRDIIETVLDSQPADEEERLRSLIAKKAKLPRYQKEPQKLAQYLVRQGFDYQSVKQSLKIHSPED